MRGLVLKPFAQYTDHERTLLYGVVDGAHRVVSLNRIVDEGTNPKYTLDYLVPCQILSHDMSEELTIAIATRES